MIWHYHEMREEEDGVTVGRRAGSWEPEFYVLERSGFEYGSMPGVRDCLLRHKVALERRLGTVDALLACDMPEYAERLLLDQPRVRVDEVTLHAPGLPDVATDRLDALLHPPLPPASERKGPS
jgi:hypothetical protein